MRFSKAFIDLLVINPDGVSDKKVFELGKKCGLKRKEISLIKKAMCREKILAFEKIKKENGSEELIWTIRDIKKQYAGRKKDVR